MSHKLQAWRYFCDKNINLYSEIFDAICIGMNAVNVPNSSLLSMHPLDFDMPQQHIAVA